MEGLDGRTTGRARYQTSQISVREQKKAGEKVDGLRKTRYRGVERTKRGHAYGRSFQSIKNDAVEFAYAAWITGKKETKSTTKQ
jgi:hypothetical protein